MGITVEDLEQVLSTQQVCDRLGQLRYPEEWELGNRKPLSKMTVLRYFEGEGDDRLPSYFHPMLGYLVLRDDLETFIRDVFVHIDVKGGRPSVEDARKGRRKKIDSGGDRQG